MTCPTCDRPMWPGPLCDECAAERQAHRTAKARHRAERMRRREKRPP